MSDSEKETATPPTISIVTICFNNLEELKETVSSVDMQEQHPHEHIIIDGSTNGEIRDWLSTHPQPPYRTSVSESDKGIADAFNKGVRRSTGEVLLMLNSGDKLFDPSVLLRVGEAFLADAGVQWVHGSLRLLRGGRWVVIGKPFNARLLYKGMRGTFHPTMYVRRSLFDRHGMFDTGLKIAMDFDFLCRIAEERNAFIDYPLAVFDPGGVSSKQYLRSQEESRKAYRRHFGYSLKYELWRIRQILLNHLLESRAGRWLYAMKVAMGWENK